MTALLVASLIGLLLLSTPLFVLIGVATILSYVFFVHDISGLMDVPLIESVRQLTEQEPLLAIPFFVLSGVVMSKGHIAQRLVAVARATFSAVPGGLGIATVAACMFFASISGSSPVTVITIGSIMYPALVKAGYSQRFATGLVTSAGTLGILIPPSIPMIVYAIFASNAGQNVKVEEFFLAGIGPGVLIGGLLAGACMFVGLRRGEHFTRPDFAALRDSVADGFWALMLPVIILGGIYSGMFTATEAAAVSVVYAVAVELWVHRALTLRKLPAVFAEGTVLMGSLLVIFAMAVGLNDLLTELEVPQRIAASITRLDLTPFSFMLILNGFLLIVGCLMDIMSAIMILVPLLAPLAAVCGIDPIHLGIVFIVNLELGYLTPPMGLNLFVSATLFDKSLGEVVKSVLPFAAILLFAVLVVAYVPTLSMGPVNVLKDRAFVVAFPEGGMCKVVTVEDDPLAEPTAPAAKGSIGDAMKSDKVKDLLKELEELEMEDEDLDEDDPDDDDITPKKKAPLKKPPPKAPPPKVPATGTP